MSWIAKKIEEKLMLEKLKDLSKYVRGKPPTRLLEELQKRQEEIQSIEFAERFGIDEISLTYFYHGGGFGSAPSLRVKEVHVLIWKDMAHPFSLLSILPFLKELEKQGYQIEIREYGIDIIPTKKRVEERGFWIFKRRKTTIERRSPITIEFGCFGFPMSYASHPEYSKIIDKIAKEVYGLSPPKNYEK